MAKDFEIKQQGPGFRTRVAEIASATVIEPGDLVTMTGNLIVKADANSTALAYAINGSAAGETSIEITEGNDFTLVGTGNDVYSKNKRGDLVDLVVDNGTQLIDVGASVKDVFQIIGAEDSGTVGSASGIEVRINKPLF